jgi:hypothetical protein
MLKLSITKLARIDDYDAKLRRAVLINNTLKKVQREAPCEYDEVMVQDMEDEEEVEEEEQEEEQEAPVEDTDSKAVITAEEDAVTTLALYKDVINDFLGVIDFPKFSESEKLEPEVRPEDFWDSVREAEGEQAGVRQEEVSQYSYGSFLSEVYRVTLQGIKERVKN